MPLVEVPHWIRTKSKGAIYSVDVTSDAAYFATAGSDGKVRIWDGKTMEFQPTGIVTDWKTSEYQPGEVSDEIQESGQESLPQDGRGGIAGGGDAGKSGNGTTLLEKHVNGDGEGKDSRLLATLGAHEGSVLALRFSHDGKFLASAGDDTQVCIYTKMMTNGGEHKFNLVDDSGSWMRTKLCKGHNLDVVGVDFSCDDRILCSCSLDKESPLILWDLHSSNGMILSPLKVLHGGHTSLVKGVAFDPLNTYLATAGDDCKICIWTLDGELEKCVDFSTDPRCKDNSNLVLPSSAQSLFSRISWSPDGSYLCCTNVTMKNKPIAAMLKRSKWSSDNTINLVGHKQSVCASDFCEDFIEDGHKLLALGDKRGLLTLWSTKASKPIFKIYASKTSITDVRFCEGFERSIVIFISSLDGSIVMIKLSEDEVGQITKRKDHFKSKYGVETIAQTSTSTGNLVEDSVAVLLDSKSANKSIATPTFSRTPKMNMVKPKYSSKTGKKRIRPQLINVVPVCTNQESIQKNKPLSSNLDPISKAKEATERAIKRIKLSNDTTLNNARKESILPKPHTPNEVKQNGVELFDHPSAFYSKPATVSNLSICLNESSTIGKTLCDVSNEGENAVLIISKLGNILWQETLVSARITTLASSESFLALGSMDGSIYLYGTSPCQHFSSGKIIRASPPLVLKSAIYSIHFYEDSNGNDERGRLTTMLVVCSDLSFHFLSLSPTRRCIYRGTMSPAFYNMSNFCIANKPPQIERIQMTKAGILLVLSSGDGAHYHAFIYDKDLELWQRFTDHRFVLSNFYSFISTSTYEFSSKKESSPGLSDIQALCGPSHKIGSIPRSGLDVTRSHCEDRMACAILLKDSKAFKYWLGRYAHRIASSSDCDGNDVRFLLDLVQGKDVVGFADNKCWWWLGDEKSKILGMSRKSLLESIVVPELAKNRSLQRLVREISIDIDTMP